MFTTHKDRTLHVRSANTSPTPCVTTCKACAPFIFTKRDTLARLNAHPQKGTKILLKGYHKCVPFCEWVEWTAFKMLKPSCQRESWLGGHLACYGPCDLLCFECWFLLIFFLWASHPLHHLIIMKIVSL